MQNTRKSADVSHPGAQSPDDAALTRALKQLGYDAFRPGQREAVTELLQARRLLLVAPTGGGKSLCYQLPALLLPGTTLVVSPLIALMHDQVEGLLRRGVRATFFASTLESQQMRERMAKLRDGAYQIVYAAPERLVLDGFRALLTEVGLPLVAIDEAHCISEWGHDFRPEYLKIGEMLRELPDARVVACTATATPIVRDEILARLGLPSETPQLVQGFARPNLALNVQEAPSLRERQRAIDTLLHSALGETRKPIGTAIIYAPTRKGAEEEAMRLLKAGYRAGAYHAGLDGGERERVQNAFIGGALDVAVATNAFGMGIDRSDVRAVAHLAPPGSLEAYYQEVGRAGRDGGPAEGLLLIGPSDLPLRRNLLNRPNPDGTAAPANVVEHKWQLFLELMRWAEGGSCRHDAILRYFGDEHEALAGCGRCDNCLLLADEGAQASQDEVSLVVRKALSAIARVHNRFGLKAAIQLLRGVTDERLQRAGFDRVKTFGVLKDHDERWLMALLRRCITAGWVDFVGDERPMVVLTRQGQRIMQGEVPARILLPLARPAKRADRPQRPGTGRFAGKSGSDVALELDDAGQRVFASLRAVRLQLSQAAKVPPYVVASDRTLRDLATLRPANLEELTNAHGIGPTKVERFGQAFLQAIAQA